MKKPGFKPKSIKDLTENNLKTQDTEEKPSEKLLTKRSTRANSEANLS